MHIIHQEKLLPSPALLLVALIFGVTLGIIVTVLSEPVGLVIGIFLGIALPLLLILSAPKIVVTDELLIAGRARIPLRFLQFPQALEPVQMQSVLGANYNPQNFYLIRGWIKTGLEVKVTDPEDPTGKWILSSRSPEIFVAALNKALQSSAQNSL